MCVWVLRNEYLGLVSCAGVGVDVGCECVQCNVARGLCVCIYVYGCTLPRARNEHFQSTRLVARR